MQYAAKQHKHMKHAVEPTLFRADAVEHCAERIADSACEQEPESTVCQRPHGVGKEQHDAPAHEDITDH
ncbi:hypothetical protein SDC9_209512 [bioreactor metagenome]|uniref:Uncharacterized protein n=1 Tax=bioreactor metagenome TaxID=1076179 RepID=A0A645JFA7_9ZZZZ